MRPRSAQPHFDRLALVKAVVRNDGPLCPSLGAQSSRARRLGAVDENRRKNEAKREK